MKIITLALLCFSVSITYPTETPKTFTFKGKANIVNNFIVNSEQPTSSNSKGLFSGLFNMVRNYKSTVLTLSALGCIPTTLFLYYFYHTKKLLNNSSAWTKWKPSLSLGSLLEWPMKDLKKDLSCDIRSRYSTEESNSDTLFYSFAADISSEKATLEKYILISKLVNQLRISSFIAQHEIIEQQAQDAIKKLKYLTSMAQDELFNASSNNPS